MSTKFIAENLKQTKYDVDYILLPGMVYGDAKIVEEVTGVKTFKGTEEAWDLPRVIEALKNGVQLSTTEPADKIIGKMDNIEEKLRKIEEEAKISFEINGVKITNYPPPFRIFLEIDNKQEFEKLERLRRNINVVVLGLPVGHYDLDEVKNKVKQLVDYGHVVGIRC